MRLSNINEYKGGWFVGDFNPSIFKNPFFEVAPPTMLRQNIIEKYDLKEGYSSLLSV